MYIYNKLEDFFKTTKWIFFLKTAHKYFLKRMKNEIQKHKNAF